MMSVSTPPSPGLQSPGFGRCPLSETAVVTKTLSPHTIGCDQPTPGNFAFQATWSSADQVSGCFASVATPSPSGPRNRGQFCAAAALHTNTQKHAAKEGK